jgi:hypothetical protein
MGIKKRFFVLWIGALLSGFYPWTFAQEPYVTNDGKSESSETSAPVLWREPSDIASRNLLYGPGGQDHQPHPPFTFEREDLSGSNPKFDVRDRDGVKWRVKLGAEAKPETVAVRLLWAVGYFANEDYFLPDFRADNMPDHLKRGSKFVEPDGSMKDVRLKRYSKDEKKAGTWQWRRNPFTGTRELNGLRVMMAVINNWDLKDENNAIYREKNPDNPAINELVYMVSDLGASFGTTNFVPNHKKAKGNLRSYDSSTFIRKVDGGFVDFGDPTRPGFLVMFNPPEYVSRLNLEWIGRHVPVADAQWIGQLLGTLSTEQIRDAFRAAQYTPEEVGAFSTLVQARIAELKRL